MWGIPSLAYAVAAPLEMIALVVLSCWVVGIPAGLSGLAPMAALLALNFWLVNKSGSQQVVFLFSRAPAPKTPHGANVSPCCLVLLLCCVASFLMRDCVCRTNLMQRN